jgi:hypothetical protein
VIAFDNAERFAPQTTERLMISTATAP